MVLWGMIKPSDNREVNMLRTWWDLTNWEKDICNTTDECLCPRDRDIKRKLRQELEENDIKKKLFDKLRKEIN